jgi:26S proteasome regulatory subunit N9
MGMAVLIGKNIYNITELLEKDILTSLKGSDFEWLYHLLQSLGTGQIHEFCQGIEKYRDTLQRFPAVIKEVDHLHQKVRIVALLEMIFKCNKDERSLQFSTIAEKCLVEQADVEYLLMKSMSLNLIKGTID